MERTMDTVWIVGVGTIGIEYTKVLKAQGYHVIAIGRGEQSAHHYEDITGIRAFVGGVDSFLATNPMLPKAAIIAVNVQQLASVTLSLIHYGIKNILCEKPGYNDPSELEKVYQDAKCFNSNVFYAYNRRFYSSTLEAERIIKNDGGLTSFCFEFTEWGHVIEQKGFAPDVLRNWFYANSTHVVDLAFFFGGVPRELSAFTSGELLWHKPAVFAGAGITEKHVLFSYQANWNAPGRWAVELLTSKHRLYLKPMETLQIQEKGNVKVTPVEIDDALDKQFKPGFYQEVKAFLTDDYSRMCPVQIQYQNLMTIYKIINDKKC